LLITGVNKWFIYAREKALHLLLIFLLLIYQVSDKKLLSGCGTREGFLAETGNGSPASPAHPKSRSPEQVITSPISGRSLKAACRSFNDWVPGQESK
jgi:hypothetical protein